MNAGKKFSGVIVSVGIFSFFTGGLGGKKHVVGGAVSAPTPVLLPEGTRITGLRATRQGTAMEPYYILRETSDGVFMKITNQCPEQFFKNIPEEENEIYYGAWDVFENEYASSVKITDEQLAGVTDIVEKYGALGWDGWNEFRPMPAGQVDGDFYISLFIELSDKTTVEMSGNRASPDGWNGFFRELSAVFDRYADFTRYDAKDFAAAKCSYLSFNCRRGKTKTALMMNANVLIVNVSDPDGELVPDGADFGLRLDGGGERPYGRFVEILIKHGAECWENKGASWAPNTDCFELSLCFENNTSFSASGSGGFPEGFDDFLKEFAAEMSAAFNG